MNQLGDVPCEAGLRGSLSAMSGGGASRWALGASHVDDLCRLTLRLCKLLWAMCLAKRAKPNSGLPLPTQCAIAVLFAAAENALLVDVHS
eukprot:CAMPEP_0171089030 /NCGR_PEP_ID=MMETSP0766_2-20121228/21135_1 /TAXON_ID=439317 /ORGANISM="Gambierdiscus australes, Strain CAWD 149" /LENGTH=89 /DNA_ID=CAMNT_0011546859 /DNA_START=10 /DNA_END=276 /DNA_ORIENTATION=+